MAKKKTTHSEPLPPLREQHSSVGFEEAVEQGRVYSRTLDSTKPETFLEAKLEAMGQQIEHFKTQLANAEKALADEQMRQGGVLGTRLLPPNELAVMVDIIKANLAHYQRAYGMKA